MGKHLARAAVRREAQRRRQAIRFVIGAGTAVVAASGFALTANGAVLGPFQEAAAAAAPAPAAVAPAIVVAERVAAVAASPVSASAEAALSFSRPEVRTVAKPQPKKLVVAAAVPQRPGAGTLLAPLKVLNPSSPYGHRTSPITGTPGEFHWGEDFAAACGTAVYSADAGVVRAAGWDKGGGGNRVEVDHGNGLVTTYNHLETIDVRKGEPVQPGELIAKVGTTGSSTGCHLHFETIEDGVHADPENWTLLPARPTTPSAG